MNDRWKCVIEGYLWQFRIKSCDEHEHGMINIWERDGRFIVEKQAYAHLKGWHTAWLSEPLDTLFEAQLVGEDVFDEYYQQSLD